MEKIVEQGILYDFYGPLLTQHQQEVYEACVFEDLSLAEAAERFEAEGNYEKACYNYEQLLFEKYYMPAPYDRLIKIYSKAHLKDAEKEVLKASISHFKELRESRLQYVEHLADKYGAIEFLSQRVHDGKKITYFSGVFELYNPFPIVEEWEKRLAKLES